MISRSRGVSGETVLAISISRKDAKNAMITY